MIIVQEEEEVTVGHYLLESVFWILRWRLKRSVSLIEG